MNHNRSVLNQKKRRTWRVRKSITGTAERPRMSVFRSHKHLYVQLIDDGSGRTLCAASTSESDLSDVKYGGNVKAAAAVGRVIAEKAKAAGISKVSFDRGPYKYHGRVASLAAAAREAGLSF
jgi:large subunit ribosomal protein L18